MVKGIKSVPSVCVCVCLSVCQRSRVWIQNLVQRLASTISQTSSQVKGQGPHVEDRDFQHFGWNGQYRFTLTWLWCHMISYHDVTGHSMMSWCHSMTSCFRQKYCQRGHYQWLCGRWLQCLGIFIIFLDEDGECYAVLSCICV